MDFLKHSIFGWLKLKKNFNYIKQEKKISGKAGVAM